MARKILHQLVDDLDGSELVVGTGETILFSLDGIAYEIDLSDENAAALRDAFAPFVAAGRSVSRTASRGTTAPRGRRRTPARDVSEIREWARANGHTISERGRIPGNVLEAYEAAH